MSVFKCKMCGGTLEIKNNETVAVCEYCGTKQTLPKLDDDRKANLYDRANHFRRNNEFDKAMGIYEQILNSDNTDAESYWSLVLCRYGIEYVEDPATHKRIPTVNRAQYTSIFDDEDYKSALQYADSNQKDIYEAEAVAINEIQKGILAISQKEEPFDVFICYKETDTNGRRTPDSVLATELYHELTREGFKVFFSRITLEDKLGQEYEPYIFAALNSAKVMVVLGTKPEYFNAVWVKNEWNRYLALIKNGARKVLIPAYKDMDPYDLPEEFSHLQAQDMSKLGFMQDLIRGIKKLAQPEEIKKPAKETSAANVNTSPLLKRAFMFLEDGDFERADDFCEQVLNQDPENAQAYLGKLMAELKVCKPEDLADCEEPFDKNSNYKKALRFADEKLSSTMKSYVLDINERIENELLEGIYSTAVDIMNSAETQDDCEIAAHKFESIESYKNSSALAKECHAKAEIIRKDTVYYRACEILDDSCQWDVKAYEKSIADFESLNGWKDSKEIIILCKNKIQDIKIREEEKRLEAERKAEEERLAHEKAVKKRKKFFAIATPVVCAIIAFSVLFSNVILPSIRYNNGLELLESGDYAKAIEAFSAAGDYKDAPEKQLACHYSEGAELMSSGSYMKALEAFKLADNYKDAPEKQLACYYKEGVELLKSKEYLKAYKAFSAAGDYEDTYDKMRICIINTSISRISAGGLQTIGLKSDGTVVAVGSNGYGQCGVSAWNDIVAISAGGAHTAGLKTDGTVVAVGNNDDGQCEVSDWNDIVAISASGAHTVGLKSDGTVVAVGDSFAGQCEVSAWNDIIAISAGTYNTIGLKSDGTVVAVGNNMYGQCEISDWNDIVAISAGSFHTIGVKSDGTVVAVGKKDDGQCDVSDWNDIVAISAGSFHTIGVKSDGTVVAVGAMKHGQCDVYDFGKLF